MVKTKNKVQIRKRGRGVVSHDSKGPCMSNIEKNFTKKIF